MNKDIEKVYADVKSLLEDWRQVCRKHELLEQKDFLGNMKDHILALDEHTEKLSSHKKIHDLLFHILHTPGGAPVVMEESLFSSAKQFTIGDAGHSSLHKFLEKSLTSSNEHDNYLFNSISILEEQLKRAA